MQRREAVQGPVVRQEQAEHHIRGHDGRTRAFDGHQQEERESDGRLQHEAAGVAPQVARRGGQPRHDRHEQVHRLIHPHPRGDESHRFVDPAGRQLASGKHRQSLEREIRDAEEQRERDGERGLQPPFGRDAPARAVERIPHSSGPGGAPSRGTRRPCSKRENAWIDRNGGVTSPGAMSQPGSRSE